MAEFPHTHAWTRRLKRHGGVGTRTEELMDAIRGRIAGRALATGDRLPSVRAFAETMGVSPSTVV
ncbi:GntR family transcriptional regulator, partial [Klebsiella pneumoniae]